MLNDERERAAFEAWADNDGWDLDRVHSDAPYSHRPTRLTWEGWLARASQDTNAACVAALEATVARLREALIAAKPWVKVSGPGWDRSREVAKLIDAALNPAPGQEGADWSVHAAEFLDALADEQDALAIAGPAADVYIHREWEGAYRDASARLRLLLRRS